MSGDVASRVRVLRRRTRRRRGVQREIGMALNVAHWRLINQLINQSIKKKK
jgi:hypothetical protein